MLRLNENVQGLHYSNEDGPTLQFWPIQHEFFSGQNKRTLYPQDSEDPPDRINFSSATEPAVPHPPGYASRTTMGSSHLDNWSSSWDWDGFLFRAQAVDNGNTLEGQGSSQLQVSKQKPSSSREDSEGNRNFNEPTSLELGLGNNPSPGGDNDSLLALTLGGPDELPPDAKRSRHSPPEIQKPRCQVDNCTADLQNAKDYHRRHKVCEFHAKAPKAPVARIMQRFCQQCSRFHLLKEFDDDRRSCRRRLAGHNRRRRKAQPDTAAAAALASLLTDPNALSRIVNPLEQLQGKDELQHLLRLVNGGETLLHALSSAKSQYKPPEFGGVARDDLINAITKSQLLSNLLHSDPSITSRLEALSTPNDTQISDLSNALLRYLQHKSNENKGNGGPMSSQEMEKQSDACIDALGRQTSVRLGQQLSSVAFPTMSESIPVRTNKRNGSNENSLEKRVPIAFPQGGSMDGSFAQKDMRHLNTPNKDNHNASAKRLGQSFHTEGSVQVTEDQMQSSDLFRRKQHQTFQLWFKIFDRGPAELPLSLRSQMLEWLDHLPTDMESYVRPGCIILTVFLCMPILQWEKLCSDIQGSLSKLLEFPGGDFWSNGRVFVRLGDVSSFIIEGKVSRNFPKSQQSPKVILVRPFAVIAGEDINVFVKGHNLTTPGTKFICAYEGKCIEKEVNIVCSAKENTGKEQATDSNVQEEQAVSFSLGPFNNIGHAFVEAS